MESSLVDGGLRDAILRENRALGKDCGNEKYN
jgi:hypothetical protein